jgi:predicted aspartyl protease
MGQVKVLYDPAKLLLNGPTIPVTLTNPDNSEHSTEVHALIDTGTKSIVIDRRKAEELKLTPGDYSDDPMIGATGPPEKSLQYKLRIIFDYLDIDMTIDVLSHTRTEVNMPLILGRQFLKKLNLIYDGPSSTIWLEKED